MLCSSVQCGWDWSGASALTAETAATKTHTEHSTDESFHHYYIIISTIDNRNVKFVYEVSDGQRNKLFFKYNFFASSEYLIQYLGFLIKIMDVPDLIRPWVFFIITFFNNKSQAQNQILLLAV